MRALMAPPTLGEGGSLPTALNYGVDNH